jgi:adenylate kinase
MAIYLKIDAKSVVKRISQRRICSFCGQIYSLINNPDVEKGPCKQCGNVGTVKQRKDDMPDVVEKRLKVFAEAIEPMLEYYETKKLLNVIDASLAEDAVFKKLSELIDNFKIR